MTPRIPVSQRLLDKKHSLSTSTVTSAIPTRGNPFLVVCTPSPIGFCVSPLRLEDRQSELRTGPRSRQLANVRFSVVIRRLGRLSVLEVLAKALYNTGLANRRTGFQCCSMLIFSGRPSVAGHTPLSPNHHAPFSPIPTRQPYQKNFFGSTLRF